MLYKEENIRKINFGVEQKTSENKNVNIKENGVIDITASPGYNCLKKVIINTEVKFNYDKQWEKIGYSIEPEYIKKGVEYAKQVKENFDSDLVDQHGMFINDKQLVYFPIVDTSKIQYMDSMFSGCSNLKEVTIDLSSCINAVSLFNRCRQLEKITLLGDPSNLYTFPYSNNKFRNMFGSVEVSNQGISYDYRICRSGTLYYDKRYNYKYILDELLNVMGGSWKTVAI